MSWNQQEDFDPILCQCTRLSQFTINSAGISPSVQQRQQRARSYQGRRNIQPQQMTFDIKCDSPSAKDGLTIEDFSFYAGNSPQSSPRPCPIDTETCMDDDCGLLSLETSPAKITITQDDANIRFVSRTTQLIHDTNSLDSGYSTSLSSNDLLSMKPATQTTNTSAFKFAVPSPPSKVLTDSTSKVNIFRSFSYGSNESMDDELELMEMEDEMDDDDSTQLPGDMNSLICGDIKTIKTTPENKRYSLAKRCLDMNDSGNSNVLKAKNNLFDSSAINTTPKSTGSFKCLISTPERQCLQPISENLTPFSTRIPTISGSFKRPEPPTISPIQSKRYKSENDPPHANYPEPLIRRPVLRKSMSMNDANIMNALSRSSCEPNLIGDFSKPFCLPLIEATKNNDLKAISVDTMAGLLRGDYDENVASFRIIDCRYPYEYEGGHIQGALNLYTQDQVLDTLMKKKTELSAVDTTASAGNDTKRHILVFHCEFSSERGPKLSRFLRNHDRMCNSNSYPALHYPEIYLLHGGYKDFFAAHSDMCTPNSYRPMLHSDFTEQYRVCRAKSKSWTGDIRSTASGRLTKSRSRLVL